MPLGGVVSRQLYDAWGNVRQRGTLPTDIGYTGQREDTSTNLMFYNARYYSPLLGRFISADTIVPNGKNPQQFNRYTYVLNNPLKNIDPTGHMCLNDETGKPGPCDHTRPEKKVSQITLGSDLFPNGPKGREAVSPENATPVATVNGTTLYAGCMIPGGLCTTMTYYPLTGSETDVFEAMLADRLIPGASPLETGLNVAINDAIETLLSTGPVPVGPISSIWNATEIVDAKSYGAAYMAVNSVSHKEGDVLGQRFVLNPVTVVLIQKMYVPQRFLFVGTQGWMDAQQAIMVVVGSKGNISRAVVMSGINISQIQLDLKKLTGR